MIYWTGNPYLYVYMYKAHYYNTISFVDLRVSESSPLLYSPRSVPQHGHCHPGHPRINTTSHHRVLALYNPTQNLDVDLLPKVIKISDCMSVDGPTISNVVCCG